ncbi:MAG: MFS transporter [Promethearchaeota archaeon]
MVHEFLNRKKLKSGVTEKNSRIKELWPIMLSYAFISLTHATIIINMITLSNIIWPGESVHLLEMGLILTTSLWATAFSGILIGGLTDRYSRKKLLIFVLLLTGIAWTLYGIPPAGQGMNTWYIYIIASILSGFGIGGIRPILLSYTNDFLEKDNRSAFFGRYYSVGSLFIPIGMIFSAILIQNGFWRLYFWIIGILIILSAVNVFLHIREPIRGLHSSDELKAVLSNQDSYVKYDYRMTKNTVRLTIFRSTNLLALIEGIFSWILFGTVQFLMVLFLQQEPNNLSSISVALFMIIFAVPGTIAGTILFSKRSDKWGSKDIKKRLNLIILALILVGIIQLVFFLIPLPGFSLLEGNNILFLLQSAWIWVLGILLFTRFTVSILYNTNQPPVLQTINLPEAQGIVSSWNQFVETIGQGIGPTIASLLLIITYNNFEITALILFLLALPGIIMWVYAKRTINKDVEIVTKILSDRAIELGVNRH